MIPSKKGRPVVSDGAFGGTKPNKQIIKSLYKT